MVSKLYSQSPIKCCNFLFYNYGNYLSLYFSQDDEVFLEAQVQNITSSPMVMESVKLEPSSAYTVTDLNVFPVDQKIG